MKQFTEEDLVKVYFAAYESSGDISMLIAFDEKTLNDYELLRSCGEMDAIYSVDILPSSDFYKKALEKDEYLKECIAEMNEEN